MCGRFNIISDPLARYLLEITGQTMEITEEFNIAPTEHVPVLYKEPRSDKQNSRDEEDSKPWNLNLMRWWLVPSWAPAITNKYAMFNARSESLDTSRAFSHPLKSKRCIIPASGYYEWRKFDGNKQPLYISPAETDGLLFAGLWDSWQKENGDTLLSCTIITKAAVGEMKTIHERIPVILGENTAKRWLDHDTDIDIDSLHMILKATNGIDLRVTPVSNWVNNPRHKDEGCIYSDGDSSIIKALI